MNWYIVQAYSGFEKKVVDLIKEELKKHKLSEKLEEILVPTHQVTEVKKGKRTKKEKKFFDAGIRVSVPIYRTRLQGTFFYPLVYARKCHLEDWDFQ